MTADVIIRAPDVVEDHQEWIRARVLDLKRDGYQFFRVGFPDEDPRDLFLEAWRDGAPKEQGPPPWELPGYVPRPKLEALKGEVIPPRPHGTVAVKGHQVALLDGSPVDSHGSHRRKLPSGQQASYVVMHDNWMAFRQPVRPHRERIRHLVCMSATDIHPKMAATLARDPRFYQALFCFKCRAHFRCGPDGEFIWDKSDTKVGV